MLEVKGIAVEYVDTGTAAEVVRDVSLSVAGGEIVSLVGESGCGKSTLALAILGLTRRGGRITRGSVRFEGHELLGQTDAAWRKVRGGRIGLIPQNPRGALNPLMRIGDQIAAYYQSHNRATDAEARRRSVELLELVGINDPERRLSAFPHELSGGMAQRVLIALALCNSPRLILADEPSSGLDVTIQAQVLDDMKRSVAAAGSSLLLITQDLGVVANYADRVYLMHAGEVAEEAPVLRFFENAEHPASIALLAAQGSQHDHRAVRLRGMPVDPRNAPPGCLAHRRCPFAAEEHGCFDRHPELEEVFGRHRVRCHRHAEILALAAAGERELTDTPERARA